MYPALYNIQPFFSLCEQHLDMKSDMMFFSLFLSGLSPTSVRGRFKVSVYVYIPKMLLRL